MEKTEKPRWLRRPEESLGVALLVLIFTTIALQVVTRFVFRAPLFWTEEAARYLFVWLVTVGGAEVVRARAHITMDVFATMLPARLQLVLSALLNLAILGCLMLLVWYGWFGMLRASRVMSVAVGVPESFLYGALPFGAALMALRTLLVLIEDVSAAIRPQPKPPEIHGSPERFL